MLPALPLSSGTPVLLHSCPVQDVRWSVWRTGPRRAPAPSCCLTTPPPWWGECTTVNGLLQMVQHGVLSTAGTNFSKLKKFFGKLGITGIEPW